MVGITPLFLAARGGNIDLVKVLLRHNAHVNCVGAAQQISPLHWAAHKEQPHIAVALIKHGADVHLKDKEGRTPLSLASPELATRMLEAAKQQNPQMAMDGPPIPSVSAEEKAMTACCGGNVQALQSLLNAGVSINYTNKDSTLTLLHMGAYCGQMGVVALLLSNGANWRIKDKDGDCVLHFACMKEAPQGNHKGTLQLLLSSPAGLLINSQNSRGDTPLLVAIRCQYSDRAKVLLQYNADAKLKNNKNELPLHRACCSDNNIGLVLELAELTSDLDVQDMDGWTPLMFAARSKSPNIVHYLLQRGVNPNLQQSVGFSALHLAVQENCLEVCQHLLKHKANPSICGGLQSLTPLHIASHKSFKDICCVLIEAGADYTLRDKDGDTPLSLTEDEEIKELITNASGQQGNNCQSRNSPILCKFSKSNEKEEMTQQVEEQQKMMSCILKDLKSLRSENEQLHSHLRACKEDLKQQELLYKITQLSRNNSEDDIDIEACCTKWWRIQESEMEIAEEQMNTTYELFQRFFDVFKGSFRETDVAVKKVNSRFNFDADTRKTFLRDVDKLSHLHHPNLVQFMGSCMVESSGLYCVVFEYMPRGDLDAFIHHHKVELDKIPKMLIILDIASGMAYLHSFPILHRNLIPTNILLGKDLTAKISDFGFYETKVQTNFYASIRKACCKDLTNKRRPLYKAPEAIERNEFTTASDVYSFSMVMYEIVTYMKPYFDMDLCSNAMAWVMKILMGARPTLPPGLPPSCHNMINLCWNSNPAIRPSFKEFIAHCKEQIKLAREEENVTTPQNNENNDIITN
jgi:ankyrin repeat protein